MDFGKANEFGIRQHLVHVEFIEVAAIGEEIDFLLARVRGGAIDSIGAIGAIDTVRPRCRSHTVRLGVLSSRSMRKKLRGLMPHVEMCPYRYASDGRESLSTKGTDFSERCGPKS